MSQPTQESGASHAGAFQRAYADRNVCVTGGAGFIGSNLVEALVGCGARVHIIDDLSSGRESNLDSIIESVKLTRASILDDDALRAACADAETVFHLAAVTSVPRSVEEPTLFHEINAIGTARVLEAARLGTTTRLVYASSSSVYGEQAGDVKDETMYPDPRSPYAASKLAGEVMLQAYAHCYDLSCISLRYFNIFGPKQRADSPYAAVIARFIDAMSRNKTVQIFGDGRQTRDFTYVANAVHANLLAGATQQPFNGEVVNIACGGSTSVMHLAQQIAALFGVEGQFRFAPPRPGELQHSEANIDRAHELIGYEPVVDFQSGLRETAKAIQSERAPKP